MRKALLLVTAVVLLLVALPVLAETPEEYTYNIVKESHKIKNKWDLAGTFVSFRTWAMSSAQWDYVPIGTTWTYQIHVKEAVDGNVSVGTIHLTATKADGTVVDVVGHVDAAKTNYVYWYSNPSNSVVNGLPNLAAVGTTVYNDVPYNFMFLYCNDAIWMSLSQASYTTSGPRRLSGLAASGCTTCSARSTPRTTSRLTTKPSTSAPYAHGQSGP